MIEPWRVGVLFSQTGVTAAVETTQLNATLLAIDEINEAGGAAGRPIEPIVYDPASTPRRFRTLAERLLIEDRVRVIFGCYMSSTRKAVLPVVEAARGLLMYPTLYEGFEYSPNCIYTGAAPNQNSQQLARYLFRHHGNRVVFIGSNYVYPYESNRIMGDLVRQAKGQVLDEMYVPLDPRPADLERALKAVSRARPDVIFSTVVGSGTAMLYDAYHRAGFDSSALPIASLTTSEAEVAEMRPEAAAGHITAAPFFQTLDQPAASRFVAAYQHRHGPAAAVPAAAEAAYFQVHLAAGALARGGGEAPEQLREGLTGLEFNAPQGQVRIEPANNHTHLWPRVARLDPTGRFRVVWTAPARVRPDPYRVMQELDPEAGHWPGRVEA